MSKYKIGSDIFPTYTDVKKIQAVISEREALKLKFLDVIFFLIFFPFSIILLVLHIFKGLAIKK